MNTLQITTFLSATQGIEMRAPCSRFDQRKTYARVLDDDQPLSRRLRIFKSEELNCIWGSAVKEFVEKYATRLSGLRVIKQLDPHLTNFEYAIGKIDKSLIDLLNKYEIQHLVSEYFDAVDAPQENDLVVYYQGIQPVHAGLYRKPINRTSVGSVESKWCTGFTNPYVYQHEFFLIPHHFGELMRVYRYRQAKRELEPAIEPGKILHTKEEGAYRFNPTEENRSIRTIIDETGDPDWLMQKVPQIRALEKRVPTICFMYAMSEILPKYEIALAHEFDLGGKNESQILKQHFSPVTEPQRGDLAVYTNERGERKHMGVYLSPNLIESKWGRGSVYQHPPFYVIPSYGDTITHYRLKPGIEYINNPELNTCIIS